MLIVDFQVVNFTFCCNLWEWSQNKLSRNLKMYVLSAMTIGVLLGVQGNVGGRMSLLRFSLNLCCDCGCGPHNKPSYSSFEIVVFLACLLQISTFNVLTIGIVVCRRGPNETHNHGLKSLLFVICGCGPNDQPKSLLFYVFCSSWV